MQNLLKKAWPFVLIILGFLVLSYAYAPQVIGGKVMNQSDISSWKGMSHEASVYNKAHPDDPTYWTGSMFSGMPTTSFMGDYKGDSTNFLYKILLTGKRPPVYFFISLLGAFLMFLAFGCDIYLSVVGAIAVTFCSYNMQILQVGHNTKMQAIAYMPWVIASIVYSYKKRPFIGSVLFGFALSFQIKANHPQISYYLAMIILVFVIAEFIHAINERKIRNFFKASILLLIMGLLGIGANANKLLPLYKYQKHTMRGGTELTNNQNLQTGNGLKLDYATAWSYGIEETPNLLIPNFNGGSSSGALGTSSKTYNVLKNKYRGADQIIKQLPTYWGPQPFTAGPMYMGAFCIFLFILGLFIVKGYYKWWLVAITIIALLLSYGSHALWFTKLFFYHVPLYNKFRTVSMILVILQMTIPILGILAIKEVNRIKNTGTLADRKGFQKNMMWSVIITLGFCLFFVLAPAWGNFSSSADSSLPADLVASLRADRVSLVRMDAFRSFLLIALGALVLWLGYKKRIKPLLAVSLMGVIILVDLWNVDKRYLNSSHFVDAYKFNNQFPLRTADKSIFNIEKELAEKTGIEDPDYRVLDLSVNTFNDAHISYHHKTIGGYSPAKLQRYQDLIDYYISPEMQQLSKDVNKVAKSAKSMQDIEAALGDYPILSMLNTKYIVINGEADPLRYNPYGHAWFVSSVKNTKSADEEISEIGKVDLRTTAVISYKTPLSASNQLSAPEKIQQPASDASSITSNDSIAINNNEDCIRLTEYKPNMLSYISDNANRGLVVFSEVYYPDGWKASIDGYPAKILCANYTLRALEIPAGHHNIKFVFKPISYKIGATISSVCSILLWIFICLISFFEYNETRKRIL